MNFLDHWLGKLCVITIAVATLADVSNCSQRARAYHAPYDEYSGLSEWQGEPFAPSASSEFSWLQITIVGWILLGFVAYKVSDHLERRREARERKIIAEMQNDPEWQEHARLIRANSDPRLLRPIDPTKGRE